ncbi:MAG: hypothetical protein Q9201_006871 [Fulgogasparrea decipioides]
MSKRLRGLVTRRLSLIGPQLQVLWRKTLTSGHLLKQAFSPQSSPQSANFPTARPNDDPLHETFLPVFNTELPNALNLTHGNAVGLILPQELTTTSTAPATSNSERKISTTEGFTAGIRNAESQTDNLANHSSCSSGHRSTTPPLYADGVTQTEFSTPETTQILDLANSEAENDQDGVVEKASGVNPRDDDLRSNVDAASSDHSESPEILHGPSQVFATDFLGKSHLAILVTTEMVDYLNEVAVENSKLERLKEKLEKVDREVDFATHNVEYLESLIPDTEPQEMIDRLHKDIEYHQNNLKKYKARRDVLQPHVSDLKRNVDYLRALSQSSFRKVLTEGRLVKSIEEIEAEGIPDKEDMDEEVDESPSTDGRPDLTPDEVVDFTYSDASSEVSIEELARRVAGEEVKQRHAELLQAQEEFDERNQAYAQQKARFQQMVDDGAAPMTQTEFDHCGIDATRALGQDLSIAEHAYEEALARRNKLGPNDWDQESGFTEDYDGYPLSWEGDGIAAAPRDFIYTWLEDIPEVEDIPDIEDLAEGGGGEFGQKDQEDVEDWDIRSARMSDAWSCRDWTRNRKRIDRWRAITGRAR